MEDDVLKFSDFIQDDGLFGRLQILLRGLNEQLGSVTESAKIFAKALDASVKAGEDTKEVAVIIEGLRKAYVSLVKTQTEAGKTEAALNEVTKQQGKIQGAAAKQVINATGSYYQLQAALEEALTKYKMLSAEEVKNSKEAAELLKRIEDLRAKIGEIDRTLGSIGLVTTKDKLRAQIANLEEEGQVMADLRQRAMDLKAAQKTLASGKFFSPEGIAQAETIRNSFVELRQQLKDNKIDQQQYDEGLKQLIADTQKLVAAEKQIGKSYAKQRIAEGARPEAGVKITRDPNGVLQDIQVTKMELLTYEQLNAVYQLITETLRNYNAEQLDTDETAKRLVKTQGEATNQLNKFDKATGKVARQWDGLKMQVTQVIREAPAAAISLNTFFLAISNNIPYLADEISRARQENERLKASGQTTVPVIKQIGAALKSWNTILVIILTVFSFFGREILSNIGKLLKFNQVVDSADKAMAGLAKEVATTNDNFGASVATLQKLSSLWKDLSSNEDRAKFLKMYSSEITSLGLGIKSVEDAEIAFNERTDEIVKAYEARAKSAAALKLAQDKYVEALKATANIEKHQETIRKYQEEQLALAREELGFWDSVVANWHRIWSVDPAKRKIKRNREDIKNATKEAQTYLDLATQFAKRQDEILRGTGLSFRGNASEKHKEYLTRLEQFELDALKRKNDAEEALMQDGYEKNVKKIRDGYAEERKEIKKQITAITEMLNKDFGANFGDLFSLPVYMIEQMTTSGRNSEEVKRALNAIIEYKKVYDSLKKSEDADLGKEWLAEQTRRAQAAKEAVQLQLDAVKEGSEEEYNLKMQLIWKEYDAEIAANKEKEKTKQQDSLAIYEKYLKKETDLRNAHDKELRDRQIKQLELEISGLAYGREASTKTEQKIEVQRQQALAEIDQSGLSAEEQEERRLATEQYYDRLILQERIKLANQLVSVEKSQVDIETGLAKKLSSEKLRLLLAQNDLAEQTELNNAYLAATSEEEYAKMADLIIQKYKQLGNFIKGDFAVEVLDDQQALAEAIFNIVEHTEQDITRFELEQERDRLKEQIRLAKAGMLDWSDTQIKAAEATVEGINNKLKRLEGISAILDRIADHGLLGIFDMTDAQYDAWENYADFISDQIDQIIDKYVEMAQAAVDAQQQQVDAARTVYEAELEARANGYANYAATAKKELELQKQTLKEKQKKLDEANRLQRISDMASTTSSLIVAIAQLYKAYAGIPYVGLIIAGAAVAGLIAMFAASSASAKSAAAQNYGEGGYEELQGGSHASGHDIDLGVNNHRGRRMRAEGGESMAIFSRRATKRYRDVLPDLVDSINKGRFEEQYANTLVLPDEMRFGIGKERYVNLNKIESSLDQLTEQGAEHYSVMPDGTVIIKRGNVTRIIKK